MRRAVVLCEAHLICATFVAQTGVSFVKLDFGATIHEYTVQNMSYDSVLVYSVYGVDRLRISTSTERH